MAANILQSNEIPAMPATVAATPWRRQLSNRRRRLVARPELLQRKDLQALVEQIDDTLERMDRGVFGICDECHETIDADRLAADPLLRVCLDCLNPEQAEALERDLELASSIQGHLLPTAGLLTQGWEIAYRYRPLRAVSGDYCDILAPQAPGEALHFFLGDVAGKGVAASLLMANLHAVFRSLVSLQLPLDTLVERANRLFCESTLANSYASLVAGRLLPSGALEMVNAGHPAPLLVGAARRREVPATGLPLGLFCDATYSSVQLDLTLDDLLLVYTDGVSEAGNGGPEMYGPTRLPSLLESVRSLEPEAVLDALSADLRDFVEGSLPEDDVAVMAIRRSVEDAAARAGGAA